MKSSYSNVQSKGINRRNLMKASAVLGVGGLLPHVYASQLFAQEAPQRGGVLNLRISAELPNFDFYGNTTTRLLTAIAPCYNNLVHFNPQEPDEVVGDLAERWEVSADGKTCTFYLVQNAKFHDGQPFTSDDVKASFDYIVNPPAGSVSVRKDTLAVIDSIEVIDDYTVAFNLKQPAPSLLTNLASAWMVVMPRRLIETGAMKTEVCGTGPFKFKQYNQGVSVELIRNEDYHVPDRPYLDGINLYVIPSLNTGYSYLRTGRLDLYESLSERQAETIMKENDSDIILKKESSYRMDAIVLNTAREPFNNPKVREAIAYGFDRDAAVAVLRRGTITGPLPAGKWALPEDELRKLPGYGLDKEANRAKARELLKEAGYADGFQVTLPTSREESIQGAAIFVQDQLAQIGIRAKVEAAEVAAMIEQEKNRDFDMTVQAITLPVNDPDAIFGMLYRCNAVRNLPGICNAEVDALIDQQSSTLDERERQKLVWELERRVILDHGFIWIHRKDRYVGMRSNVKNLVIHPEPVNNSRRQDVWKAS